MTSEPFSSAKQVVGNWKTSVWMLAGSDGFCGPKFSQNREVSVSSGSITTRNFSLPSAFRILPSVRERLQRIEALADVAVHLAVRHHLEGADDIVQRDIELRQPIVGPVIVGSRGIAIDRLLEADDELPIILPVTRLARTQRLELSRLHIIFEGGFVVAWQREITGDLV